MKNAFIFITACIMMAGCAGSQKEAFAKTYREKGSAALTVCLQLMPTKKQKELLDAEGQDAFFRYGFLDGDDFTIQGAVEYLGLGSDRTVKQVFTGRGNMGKVVNCYKSWLSTGEFTWSKEGEHNV